MNSDDHEARVSFASGHSSFSFCCMTLFTLYLLRLFGVGGLFYFRRNDPDCDAPSNIVIAGDLEQQQQQSNHNSPASNNVRKRSKSGTMLSRMASILCILPMFVAGFIAASRIHDNFHHPADVVAGSIIGFSVAKFVYNTW